MADENTKEELLREIFPYEIRFLLLCKDRRKVLMTREYEQWDLPVVDYPFQSGSDANLAVRCCQDMEKAFSDQVHFVAVAELLGDWIVWWRKKKRKRAHATLVLAECVCHGGVDDLRLSQYSEWKNAQFVVSHLNDFDEHNVLRSVFQLVVSVMAPNTHFLGSLTGQRQKFGWHRKAANLLISTAAADGAQNIGRVSQVQVSETSTVLRAKSSQGYYYLKSPASGCEETSITQKVADLFPEACPKVLKLCTNLNCFVTRELGQAIEETEYREIVCIIGDLHFKSLPHVEELRDCGCPVRDLSTLEEKIDVWAEGREFTEGDPVAVEQMRELRPLLHNMCTRLASHDIPLTLIHGDAALCNSARSHSRKLGALLFDWEFACISHPFFDFHRIHDESDDSAIIDEYLLRWFPAEQIAEARTAYDIGVHLGYFVKIWALSDRFNASAPQIVSPVVSWARKLLRYKYWALIPRIRQMV
ncbi:hypothetical protein BWQ96_10164 [Gracilariopsis chorda]|uniref:Aminoglycoside phosphotransferase domain-containing protein n=1 Tax=Gracilariopsis chorda TaxID=448386 RepID=A0A2V3IDH0_9FLOR|nr:hypothetical protein BWQ96_10164 [Gracilariopsis chorda]|eukprot:PXF40126.1 hypothetical protein BWQ96_10164 [Gracilariopsis chorda]